MADLIIKPATGDGNKLILQDKAGGAVLTTADSGATLSNGLAMGTPASLTLTNATFPAGVPLKVYSKTYTSSHSVGVSGTWTTVGNGDSNELSITTGTPASSASKYLIHCTVCHSEHNNNCLNFRLLDGSNNHIVRGDAAGNRLRTFMGRGHYSVSASNYIIAETSGSYLWSPASASAQTIKLQASDTVGTQAFYINRSNHDNDADWQSRAVSTMTVTEIAG
jgi:hypothetical protein